MRGRNRFLKCRELECQRAIGVQAERDAIEYELVLAADLVDIDRRKPLLGHARDRDVEPHVAFLSPVGRAVRHHEHFGAGLGKTFDDFRAPDVLADRNAEPHAAKVHRARHRPRREHALLVEHAVVRQIDLVAQRRDCAAVEKRKGVVELAVLDPRRADQQGRTVCAVSRASASTAARQAA